MTRFSFIRGVHGASHCNHGTHRPKQCIISISNGHSIIQVISGHLGWVRCIALEPGNEWFATGASDRMIKVTLTTHTKFYSDWIKMFIVPWNFTIIV